MNLSENYKRLFKGRIRSNDAVLLREEAPGPGALNPSQYKLYDPNNKYSYQDLNIKVGDEAEHNWRLYTLHKAEFGIHNYGGELDFKQELRYDMNSLIKAVKKYAPSNITRLVVALKNSASKGPAAQGAAAQALYDAIIKVKPTPGEIQGKQKSSTDSKVKVDSGEVNGMDRTASGTYGNKKWELETDDGYTSIFVNGKLIDDDDSMYDDILTTVNDEGYELED